MQTSYHRAFGITVTLVSYTKGEVITIDPAVENIFTVGPNFGFVWYNVVGNDVLTNTQTGEKIDRPVGTCTLTSPIPIGEWRTELPENMTLLCASPFLNVDMVPLASHMTQFKLDAGEQTEIEIGAKLFLGQGALLIDGKTISGPQQIHFKSGTKTVTAQNNCYGFFIV